jgi:hypothetical protein
MVYMGVGVSDRDQYHESNVGNKTMAGQGVSFVAQLCKHSKVGAKHH